jgi:transposase InsO family protein
VGTAPGTGEKRGPSGVNRTADEPDQTVNVDLCFVPAVHAADHKLPAVSGSSGRLVVERLGEDTPAQTWPGRIFDDPAVAYAEAMRAFVAASPAPARPPAPAGAPDLLEGPDQGRAPREVRRAVRAQEATLRAQRRQVRQQRTADDVAWRAQRAEQRTAPVPPCAAPPRLKPPAAAAPPAPDTPHAQAVLEQRQRTHRRAVRAQRQQEDALWRQQRQSLRAQLPLPLITAWIAVLVLTDNCTRRCLGVPLFVAGPKITAEIVVAALRVLLPPDLQFLISDRGVHFTAQVFAQLAAEQHFLHVLIARHRPESNGIAERFVRTLKEWLADKTWDSADELGALLALFLAEYNARPHQGLAIPGLSPTEFARRIWLL